MTIQRILGYLLILGLLAIVTSTNAGIYKWVDENGNVQVGDRPPPEVEASDEVEISNQGDATDGAGSVPVDRKEARKRLLDQYKREREEKKEAAAKKKKEKKERQAKCKYAQNRLTEYMEHGSLYERMPNQQRKYLSDQERDAVIARARADVKKWCK